MDYYIILPAHNEETFLAVTLDSVLNQTLLPKKVILVNDNSTDKTEAIMDKYLSKSDLFHKINTISSTNHMPGSKVINAFNKGLGEIPDQFGFLVKLDADILLPPTYFEEIAKIFNKDPKVGISGGFAYEQDNKGRWKLNHPMDIDHVRGAFKSYSQACFKAIGGLRNAMGWDTLDELLARYHGFEIVTLNTLRVKHLRPTGKAYGSEAKQLQGRAMYRMRYGFLITCIASAKMAWKQKKIRIFQDNLKGYYKSKKEGEKFLVTSKEGKFIRSLRWKKIGRKLFNAR